MMIGCFSTTKMFGGILIQLHRDINQHYWIYLESNAILDVLVLLVVKVLLLN